MVKAKNKVIARDYAGKKVDGSGMAGAFIVVGMFKTIIRACL